MTDTDCSSSADDSDDEQSCNSSCSGCFLCRSSLRPPTQSSIIPAGPVESRYQQQPEPIVLPASASAGIAPDLLNGAIVYSRNGDIVARLSTTQQLEPVCDCGDPQCIWRGQFHVSNRTTEQRDDLSDSDSTSCSCDSYDSGCVLCRSRNSSRPNVVCVQPARPIGPAPIRMPQPPVPRNRQLQRDERNISQLTMEFYEVKNILCLIPKIPIFIITNDKNSRVIENNIYINEIRIYFMELIIELNEKESFEILAKPCSSSLAKYVIDESIQYLDNQNWCDINHLGLIANLLANVSYQLIMYYNNYQSQ